MNTMLSYYESRFGVAKKQGDGFNGPCPLCGGDNGKSDRFMIWEDKTKDIGKTCADHGISGVYFCRQCNASGDTISYLEKCEGFSFKDALDILGISINKDFRKKKKSSRPSTAKAFVYSSRKKCPKFYLARLCIKNSD